MFARSLLARSALAPIASSSRLGAAPSALARSAAARSFASSSARALADKTDAERKAEYDAHRVYVRLPVLSLAGLASSCCVRLASFPLRRAG